MSASHGSEICGACETQAAPDGGPIINVRLTPYLLSLVDRCAEDVGLSRAGTIRYLLEVALEDHGYL